MVSLGHTEILYRKYARNKEFDWWLHLWEIISLTFDLTAMFMLFISFYCISFLHHIQIQTESEFAQKNGEWVLESAFFSMPR